MTTKRSFESGRQGRRLPLHLAAISVSIALGAGVVSVPAAVAAPSSPPPAADGVVCRASDDVSLAELTDIVVEMLAANAPREVVDAMRANAAAFKGALAASTMPYLLVSKSGREIGGPAAEENDHFANFIVQALMKMKAGDHDAVIALENLTLDQYIETVILALYVVFVPVEIAVASFPALLGIPIASDIPLIGGYFTLGGLITLPITLGMTGIKYAANAIQANLQKTCIASGENPRPKDLLRRDLDAGLPIPPEVVAEAEKLAVASQTCAPIAEMSLGRYADRTFAALRTRVAPGDLATYDANVAAARERIRTARISRALVPLPAEELPGFLSFLGNPLANFTYGALAGLADGRVAETVAAEELTIDNGMDYAMIANALLRMVAGLAWGPADKALNDGIGTEVLLGGGVGPFTKVISVVPSPLPFLFAPLDYGLPTAKSVFRAVCLVEDEGKPARWRPSV